MFAQADPRRAKTGAHPKGLQPNLRKNNSPNDIEMKNFGPELTKIYDVIFPSREI